MKNTKELKAILTALYCINRVSKNSDKDAELIFDYAFRTIYGSNTNILSLACLGKTKETIMPQVTELLESETSYIKYLEEYRK